tara:strand:+ start:200 stop:421 length:222 start_codon:yes stop_codon:yes gene_type:complete
MSFRAGHTEIGKVDLNPGLPSLSMEEINFLLKIIAKAEFKGAQMVEIYNLTLKLQQMYIHLDKQNQLSKKNKK